ncbi:MAG: D-alanyl-D-alanine carboxypeptidase family protein [Actinomycetota bacterium]
MNPARGRRIVAAAALGFTVAAQATLVSLAAGGSSTPPPTPVPPRGSPSPFVTQLRTPHDHLERPTIGAAGALLADLDTRQAMFAKSADVRRPVASLTKVMTALLVLERLQLDDVVVVSPAAVFAGDDYGSSSSLGLRPGERQTVRDLVYALLLQSSNDAAEALSIEVSGSVDSFVGLMNRRAHALGMRDTRFFSPHGLDDRGHSTARDLLTLIEAAYDTQGFAPIVATKFHRIPAPSGPARIVQNRNVLLWLYPGAIGAKTGLTFGAGFCVIAVAEREGRRLVSIVLDGGAEPFSDAATLLDYGFDGFSEHVFLREGDLVGDVAIRGGTVPVVAGAEVAALVPTRLLDGIVPTLSVAPKAAYPPPVGARMGTVAVTAHGVTFGSAPLLATRVALPPPPDGGSWWSRAASAVGGAVLEVAAGLVG